MVELDQVRLLRRILHVELTGFAIRVRLRSRGDHIRRVPPHTEADEYFILLALKNHCDVGCSC